MFVHFSNALDMFITFMCSWEGKTSVEELAKEIKGIRAIWSRRKKLSCMKERQAAMAKLKAELESLRSKREEERCS